MLKLLNFLVFLVIFGYVFHESNACAKVMQVVNDIADIISVFGKSYVDGVPIKTINETTLLNCTTSCKADRLCNYFDYDQQTKLCRLFNLQPVKTVNYTDGIIAEKKTTADA